METLHTAISLTLNSVADILLQTSRYFQNFSRKVAIPVEKLSNGSKQTSTACVRPMYESEIFKSSPQATFPKLTVVFVTCGCDMYLIHSYASLQLSNSFPFSQFSDSCQSKIRVKTWGEESCIEELYAIPTKSRNKLLLF